MQFFKTQRIEKQTSEIAERALSEAFPSKQGNYSLYLEYSGKFNSYNANVRMQRSTITFHLSKNWKTVSSEIQIGLMQNLLCRLFKEKKKTIEMDLYELFLKNVHIATPKTKNEPFLEESFNRVNEAFFNGMLDKPNLQWGTNSTGLLGRYEYGSDTITLSTIFQNSGKDLMDYVMYHEMLHKKFKFQNKNGRTLHHSPEFRREEAKFPNQKKMEEGLKILARKHRIMQRSIFL